jgi:hypothetical protein
LNGDVDAFVSILEPLSLSPSSAPAGVATTSVLHIIVCSLANIKHNKNRPINRNHENDTTLAAPSSSVPRVIETKNTIVMFMCIFIITTTVVHYNKTSATMLYSFSDNNNNNKAASISGSIQQNMQQFAKK